MKKKTPENDLCAAEYSMLKNAVFCLGNTRDCYPLLILWCSLAVAFNVSLPVLSTFLPKAVIGQFTAGSSLQSLIAVTLLFTLSIAVLSGCKRFVDKSLYQHRFKMNAYYLRKVANKGLTTDYCNQEQEHFRKLQSESFRCCNGNYSPLTRVYDTWVALLSGALGFLVYCGILVNLHILVILFLTATTIISYFLNKGIVKWAADHNKEKIGYEQRTDYINSVSSDLRSAKDIRLYNMAQWLERVYSVNLKGLSDWYKRYAAKILGIAVADSGLSLLREGAAYAYLLYLVLTARINVAEFVLYFGAVTGFTVWLDSVLGQINTLNRINLSVNYLRAFLDYPESYLKEGGIGTGKMPALPKTIELRNVSYRYEGAEADTLHQISFTLRPAEHLAVVGLNGAGKTTLVKLICGLVDPSAGAVLYDGIDVREYDRRSYYQLFSAVFQQFSILPVTIGEIVAETAGEKVDREKAEICLRRAGLWDKVSTLPKGMDSECGKTIYDDGVELSGGEIQKLLLARALYKDAPVMILDEPTAALDPVSESRLYETYHEMMGEKSTVFISHRLASTRFCDRILLIDNGRIAEEGTHKELLSKKGRYYELFETQAKYYRAHPEGGEVAL